MTELSGLVLDHQSPPEGFQGGFDLADVRAMIRVHELADGAFRNAEPGRQGDLGNAYKGATR